MKPSKWATIFFFSLLIFCVLLSGCTKKTEVSSEPVITTTVSVPTTVPETVITQETPIIPPARPSRVPMNGIGKYLGSISYNGTGNEVTGIRVENNAYYGFTITNTTGKTLKLYMTNWNGDKTIEIYDSTKDGGRIHKSVELFKGNYYFWTINDGSYSFQVAYEP